MKISNIDNRIIVSTSTGSGVSEWTGKRFHEGDIVIDFFNEKNCSGTILVSEIDRLINKVKSNINEKNTLLKETKMNSGINIKFQITEVDFNINEISISGKVNCNVCGQTIKQNERIIAGIMDANEDSGKHLSLNIHVDCFSKFEEFINNKVKQEYKEKKNERVSHSIYIKENIETFIECEKCGKKISKGIYSTVNSYKFCIECLREIIHKIKNRNTKEHKIKGINIIERCIVCGDDFNEKEDTKIIELDSIRKIYYHRRCEETLRKLPEAKIERWKKKNISKKI